MTGGSIEDNLTVAIARLIAHKYLTIKDADVFSGTEAPNGNQVGKPGDYYFQSTLDGGIWQKTTGFGTTGWTQIVGGGNSVGGATIPYGLRIEGVNDAIVGSVDTNTLRFSGSPTPAVAGAPLADWVSVSTTAELGTQFTITMPGRYLASLSANDQSAAGESATLAISIAGVVEPTPFPQVDGVIAVNGKSDDALPAFIGVSGPFFVTQAMIDAGNNIFRAQVFVGTDLLITSPTLNLDFFGPITVV